MPLYDSRTLEWGGGILSILPDFLKMKVAAKKEIY
jgi:hypothetical protein